MGVKKFRVAISGGGIGGLTCALALSKYDDIEVDIYEAASRFAEMGAGLGIWPRHWKIMKSLGLEEDLLKLTDVKPTKESVPTFCYRKSNQAQGLSFYTLVTKGRLITLHRAEFQQVLLKHLPKACRTHCSKRLRSYTQSASGPIKLLFEDGSMATCDVLIGADGIKSSVRKSLLRETAQQASAEGRADQAERMLASVDPLWNGTVAYRALIPAEKLKAKDPSHRVLKQPLQYMGKDGYFLAYPICRGTLINFAAFTMRHDLENTQFEGPWYCPVEKGEFAGNFSNWEPEAQAIIDCVEKPTRWAIHTVKPLGSFVSNHVAIIGDAAHAMAPHQGTGAGQSIEDAYLLAMVLSHPRTTLQNVSQALRVFDTIQRPFSNQVAERARLNGQYFSLHFKGMDFEHCSQEELLERLRLLGETARENWEWTWTTSMDGALAQAVRMLES